MFWRLATNGLTSFLTIIHHFLHDTYACFVHTPQPINAVHFLLELHIYYLQAMEVLIIETV